MKKRRLLVGRLVLVAVLTLLAAARADIPQAEENPSAQPESELLLTNTTDLVGLFLEGYDYPIGSWVWTPTVFQPLTIVWANTSGLPPGLAGITNFIPTSVEGVNAWPLWVMLWPQSNTVTVLQPWSDESLTEFSVPDGFPLWHVYETNLYSSCLLFGINYTNWETLVEEGYTQFPAPQVITHAWLMDVGSRDIYWANYEAECEAAEAATAGAAGMMTGRLMLMDDDDDGGDPCSITNLTQPFYITSVTYGTNGTTITWQSCQIFRYLVSTASQLSTNTLWASQSDSYYVWGQANASSTTWTDTATTNDDGSTITQRFYRIRRLVGSPIAAGGQHGLTALSDGSLWGWGANSSGQVGDGTTTERDKAVLVAPYPCGGGETPTDTIALAAGYDFSLAVDVTGNVWTWGDNFNGQLGNGGENQGELAPSLITGVSNVVSVAGGYEHSLALRADMKVFAWGDDSYGQLGVGGLPSPYFTNVPIQTLVLTNIVAIAAGNYHSVALDAGGNVWTWGYGGDGELGNGGTTNVSKPTLLTNISNVIAIAAGHFHTVALTASNTVWAWGDNTYGELGNGSTANVLTPALVTRLSNVVAIAAGLEFSLAVDTNGLVYAWGANGSGQLGTNSTGVASTNAPMLVAGISNAVLVAANSQGSTSLAVTIDHGTNVFWGWGYDEDGEVGNGTNGINEYTPAQVQFSNRTNGCSCYQLGTSGTFMAYSTGTLVLFFNDDNFSDNAGSYTATVYGLASNVVVNGNNSSGVAIGTVSNGVIYSYSASGFCSWSNRCIPSPTNPDCTTDANGNHADGLPADCVGANWNASNAAICPVAHCFSLVGKIE